MPRWTKGRCRVRIGAHITIRDGLAEAGALATSIGADTFGFHTRNPRGSAARTVGAQEIARWRAYQAQTGLGPLVGHLPYVVNLASDRDIWDFGVRVVGQDLARCSAWGVHAIVLHPGHCPAATREHGLQRVAAGICAALEQAGGGDCLLCLEAMAGQTGEIGAVPEELGAILDACGRPARLAVCLDTCHLFAAGWDIRTHAGIDQMLAAFDAAVGRERIRALHLNDSKFPLASHRDRHERLGRGEIGAEGLTACLTHPFLGSLPTIIETPVDDYATYAEEITAARALAGGS